MLYSIVLGIVIVALGAGSVVYTFWHEGDPIQPRRRRRNAS
ncbi:hypothetical protein POF50_020685 [Streptomyces sp. SL13]|jgi:hypothetical protein|uniref:Uncharacterized protein n=1 Tax=Streptantibioticus silvisoli TaxID=2705255 RepID=A0AA90H734_9ACTN|nr:hypothetical protein [Streptantibioticus silvisoli]MDI5964218.1 hypothetical protein [Streptantibioticus silvisoli]MDI5971717.1 hypothetical protein [Streptantibioticus silvisoli]